MRHFCAIRPEIEPDTSSILYDLSKSQYRKQNPTSGCRICGLIEAAVRAAELVGIEQCTSPYPRRAKSRHNVLFKNLVGTGQQGRRDGNIDRASGTKIYCQSDLSWLLKW